MADSSENRPSIYYIPENFLGESRILNGQIRTRYLIDSIGLALISAIIIGIPVFMFALNGTSIGMKFTIGVLILAPGILAGQLGYNGDPISVFLVNFFSWRKKRETRLYNENPRLLGTDPVKAIYEGKRGMDKIVSFVQDAQERRIEKKTSEQYVEGETFEFQYDPSIDGYTEDVGDYSDDALEDEESLPVSNISIATGSDLGGLESFIIGDGYNEPDDIESSDYGVYMPQDDDFADAEDGSYESEENDNGKEN